MTKNRFETKHSGRIAKRLLTGCLGGVLIAGCDVPVSTEPIQFDKTVAPMSTVNTHERAPITSSTTKLGVLPVCKAVFDDLTRKRLTVFPVVDSVPDPSDPKNPKKKLFFPKEAHFQGPTLGHVDPAVWHAPGTFEWYDADANKVQKPDCPKQQVSITTVMADRNGIPVHAFVPSGFPENKVVDLHTPGAAKSSGVLDRSYEYADDNERRSYLRGIQGVPS